MSEKLYKYNVVIVMLAHNGVFQPDAWRMWYENASKEVQQNITLMVHSPSTYQRSSGSKHRFEKEYSINRFNDSPKIKFETTKWCDISIVYETYKAFQKAYFTMKDKPLCIYYLVSGACLPTKPAEEILIAPYYSTIHFNDNYSHSQWISLSQRVLRLLLNHSIREVNGSSYMTSIQYFSDECVDFYLSMYCYSSKYLTCPDEFLMGFFLKYLSSLSLYLDDERTIPFNIQAIHPKKITIHQWKAHTGNVHLDSIVCDASPITWRNVTKTYLIRDLGSGFIKEKYGRTNNLHYASLPTLLYFCRLQESGFFMRKIDRSIPFETLKPYLNTIYSTETTTPELQAAFDKEYKKDETRPLGEWNETSRDCVNDTVSEPAKTESIDDEDMDWGLGKPSIARSIISLYHENTKLNIHLRTLLLDRLREAHMDIYKMQKNMGGIRKVDEWIEDKTHSFKHS